MNVLVLVRWPVGGIRSYLRYVFASADMEDVHATIVAPDDGGLADYLAAHLPARRYRFVAARNCTTGLLAAAAAQLRAGDFQLLHSQGFSAGAAGELLSGLFRVPHLMTAHDTFRPEMFPGAGGRLRRFLLGRLFARIDAIHAVSRDAGSNMLAFFPVLRPERVHVVVHGIDTARFAGARPIDLRAQLGLDGEPVYLAGFFGRFMSPKGFRTLVDAVDQLVRDGRLPRRLLVLTFGDGGFVREDYAMLEERGLGGYFRRMPYTDDVAGAIRGVDLVVMPSLWEACGLLGMETLVAGVPIVGTDCIGLREVLAGSPAAVVRAGDATALAQAMLDAMRSDRRAEFAAYAPEAARRFALEDHMAGLRELYRLTAAAGRKPRD